MTTECPAPRLLKAFWNGSGEEELSSQLALHLDHCTTCLNQLETLHDSHDLLLAALSPPQTELTTQLEVRSLLQRISEKESTWQSVTTNGQSNVAVDEENDAYPKAGQRWGNFTIIRKISSGGMGAVFLAHDGQLTRHVALKVIRPSRLNETTRKRFALEATVVAKIDSPYIVPIYQLGEHKGVTFIAMPYLKGSNLSAVLATNSPLSLPKTLQIGIDICQGLKAAHAAGVVHRDIKPENLWCEATTNKVMLLDFGLACQVFSDDRLTLSGQVLGTPRYMAPEQALGKTVDHRADLFSLGCVLYQVSTGHLAFRGDSAAEILLNLTSQTPRSPCEISGVDEGLSKLTMALLEKKPGSRPKSATQVLNELRDIQARMTDADPANETAKNNLTSSVSGFSISRAAAISSLLLVIAAFVVYQVMLFVKVESGTVELTIDGGSQTVLVEITKERTITVQDPNDGEAIKIKVDKTRQQLEVSKNGFQVATKSFSTNLVTGGKLNVEFVPVPKTMEQSNAFVWPKTDELRDSFTWPASSIAPAVAPFDAAKEQARYASESGYAIETTNSIGMQLRLIPAGEFQMGIPPAEFKKLSDYFQLEAKSFSEDFAHRTVISRPFYCATTETTSKAYRRIVPIQRGNLADDKRIPIAEVSWIEAVKFCNALSRRENLLPFYDIEGDMVIFKPTANGYRLPTEAEFEFCYRAGTAGNYPVPLESLSEFCWTRSNSELTVQPVGTRKANSFGLHDLGGNLWEWCDDWFSPNYYRRFAGKVAVDPRGPAAGERRVCRGGDRYSELKRLRSTLRATFWPNQSGNDIGFRVVRPIIGPSK